MSRNYRSDSSLTETLYCLNSARPRKIPGWIVVALNYFSAHKRVCRKQTIETVLRKEPITWSPHLPYILNLCMYLSIFGTVFTPGSLNSQESILCMYRIVLYCVVLC